MNSIHSLNSQKRTKDTMNARSRLSYQKISLAIATTYAMCVAIFLGLYVNSFDSTITFVELSARWCWIIAPQLILLLYVSKFDARWAQLISLLLQIGLCSSLYNYGIPAFVHDYDDIKYELAYWHLPIWHYAIVATTGLVMKIINDY